ncbi:hypothetical protein COCMIDRAFT_106780 [Bipolaris oryzae ATCC 44560]|uniref:Scytalone dehydratase-like domain-containing protein n=1 Tax=Bipolaris oryzae ATCC 44560 TaxID=930090 RepID=W6YUI4_COCMI|nr:uncharacterized protein COCMIDRAFT_106780 [Bipolaris oryzae ATCC 44560]EUC41195.1 hypothetical protein COCMIDRAFT_106780 [Bipolaris oryzae ATCC 44560]
MSPPTYEEILSCQTVLFEWAESYDSKDWQRLKACLAPTLAVDYSAFIDKKWDALPADEFVGMVSSTHFLGNPTIRTQHLIGLGTWDKTSADIIVAHLQLRVAHQKYTDETLGTVQLTANDHGTGVLTLKCIQGQWRFAGLVPRSRWSTGDMSKVFGP